MCPYGPKCRRRDAKMSCCLRGGTTGSNHVTRCPFLPSSDFLLATVLAVRSGLASGRISGRADMTGPPNPGETGEKKPSFGGRLRAGRLALWWKSLLHDYAEACREVAQGIRQRPVKAGLYLSLLAGTVSCSLRNPSEASFDSSLLEASGTLLLLSPWTRSSSSEKHTQRLMVLRNRGQLRVQNLVFFSLLYEAPYDAGADLYQAHCKYLKPRWTDFPSRVLDVGFWGRWWVLHSRMQNSDINNEEFQYLPEHLRTISFNHLHSETNEKLFDEKYKAVILTEEQIEEADRENQGQLHS